jgi:hypothetical protein
MSVITYVPTVSKIVHETEVDFYGRPRAKDIQLMQYDSVIPIIAIALYMNKERYSIPNDPTIDCKVRWSKDGKQTVHKDILGCNSARDIVYVETDSLMTIEHGEYNPVIELIEPNNRVGSSPFKVIINRNPIQV